MSSSKIKSERSFRSAGIKLVQEFGNVFRGAQFGNKQDSDFPDGANNSQLTSP